MAWHGKPDPRSMALARLLHVIVGMQDTLTQFILQISLLLRSYSLLNFLFVTEILIFIDIEDDIFMLYSKALFRIKLWADKQNGTNVILSVKRYTGFKRGSIATWAGNAIAKVASL